MVLDRGVKRVRELNCAKFNRRERRAIIGFVPPKQRLLRPSKKWYAADVLYARSTSRHL
jgi:hypothetical protein